jgi:hypothetical protein
MSEESAKIYAKLEADIGEAQLNEIYRVLNELIATASPSGITEDSYES